MATVPSKKLDTTEAIMDALEEAGVTLDKAGAQTTVAKVEYAKGPITLPHGMSVKEAIKTLERREKYLSEEVSIVEQFDVFPWDGAHAIDVVLTKKFGWAQATATPGFFGDTPPSLVRIEVAPNVFKEVPWGSFSLPGVSGLLGTEAAFKNGRVIFALHASVQRKDEATVREVFDMVRHELQSNSIYRGQAIKIRFTDDNGKKLPMPEPKFMDTSAIDVDGAIYSAGVEEQVRVNLYTPIQRVVDCLANDISVKRGVILGGPYGTGKTLAASVASKLAVDAGITFVYVARADELSQAIEFGKQYQSPACVVFCEDIDRAMSGERSVKMDDILNIIDGIDTKRANIITVLTTNHLEHINPAMLRPGRLDAVIEVTPPDSAAVEKLVRLYGGAAIEANTDLKGVGQKLAGQIPAVIAEVVKRAKLAQLGMQERGTRVTKLTAAALLQAATSMASQIELLKRRSAEPTPEPTIDSILKGAVSSVLNGTKERVMRVHEQVGELHERIM